MVGQISNRRLVRRRNEGPETMELSSKLERGELFGSRVTVKSMAVTLNLYILVISMWCIFNPHKIVSRGEKSL